MKKTDAPSLTLGYVIFYVADVSATIDFWVAAFGCQRKFAHESGQYSELETGANWELRWDEKNIRIVQFKHRVVAA